MGVAPIPPRRNLNTKKLSQNDIGSPDGVRQVYNLTLDPLAGHPLSVNGEGDRGEVEASATTLVALRSHFEIISKQDGILASGGGLGIRDIIASSLWPRSRLAIQRSFFPF